MAGHQPSRVSTPEEEDDSVMDTDPDPASLVDPLLNPISLRFPVNSHEAHYLHTFALMRASTYDTKAWCMCVVVHITCSLVIGMFKDVLLPCYTAVLALHGVMLYAACRKTTATRRTTCFFVSRIIADTVLSRGICAWNQPYNIAGWQSISKHLLVATGIFSLWWQSFMYVLPLKWMLLTQGISLVQFHHGMTGSFCEALVASPSGQRVVACVWQAIRVAALLARIDIGQPPHVELTCTDPGLSCLPAILMLQVLLGYAAPLVILYFLERKERLGFWAASCGYPAAEVAAAAHVPVLTTAACMVVLVLVCFSAWECMVALQYSHLLH